MSPPEKASTAKEQGSFKKGGKEEESARTAEMDENNPLPSPEDANAGDEKPKDPLATVGEVFSFVPDFKTKIYIALGLLCAVISGVIFPAMAWLFSNSFEDLSAAADGLKAIRQLAFSFMILGVIAFTFMTLQSLFMELAATEMTNNLKSQWFRALLRQDMAYYDLRDVTGTASIISANAIKFKKGVGRKLSDGTQFTVTVVLGMVYGFWSSWKVSLLVLAVVPFMGMSSLFLIKMVTTKSARANSSYAKAGSIVYTTVSSIRTVLSLNGAQTMIVKFTQATQEAFDGATQQIFQLGLANGCIFSSFCLSYVPVTLYGAYLIYENVKQTGCDPSGSSPTNQVCEPVSGVGVFGALFGVTFAGSVLPQVSTAIEAFMIAQSAAYPALEAIYRGTSSDKEKEAMMEEKSQALQRRGSSAPLPKYVIDSSSQDGETPETVEGNIRFEEVHFSYPTRMEVDVFKGFSLDIPAGKTVALVGASGGGKSTTVHLIERFYDPVYGSITLDGRDLRKLNLRWLRRQIGLVSQEPKLFALSIRENIAIGCPEATQEDIEAAARKANAHDFIVSFPQGYDTQVGDQGAQLSGGQKQRIAIARVLLRKPKILLLDEATSALDSESELVVQEALDVLMQEGKQTIVVIAHRLSTIKNADMIAVVSEGKVVETGTHQELIEKQGAYYDLVEAQKGNKDKKADDSTRSSSGDLSRTSSVSSLDKEDEAVVKSTDVQSVVPVIRFRDVHFHYPSRPRHKVFRGLDLEVREGETLAIVGPSGQGKSTIIQMIESFYRPTQGSVEYQGVDMKELNVHWLRDQLALVSQEPVLFDSTIAENIRFGHPGASLEDVMWAAKQANAHDFITSFPDSYDTQVGSGSSLQVSGGQKQRIAIARALLRKPKVLLLDEATSALDSESEKVVQDALDVIMADHKQTTVVIAHRLSTVRNADRIAVIDHGKVKELGTHEELMANPKGKYRRLQELQNLDSTVAGSEAEKEEKQMVASPTSADARDHTTEDVEIEKEKEKQVAQRARMLAKGDGYYLFVGAIGAFLAGLMFPAWGFVFAFMVECLYFRVEGCDENSEPPLYPPLGFETCQEYWDYAADYMQALSFKVFYGLLALMLSAVVGNMLLFYGFSTATERMNKRVRDMAFKSLVRQEVSWFDVRQVGQITTQLSDDAALLHSFSGQPIRMLITNIGSVLIGLIISFVYMWPFALLCLGIFPFMSVGKALEIKAFMGQEEILKDDETPANSSGGVVIESLLNIRTVASLTVEEARVKNFEDALRREDPTPFKTNAIRGSTGGLSQIIQFWGFGLMFWWGGWLLFKFPTLYGFRDFLISMFGLMFGMTGIGIAMQDLTDSEKAKAAATRIFELIDRKSEIDPLSDEGKKLDEKSLICRERQENVLFVEC